MLAFGFSFHIQRKVSNLQLVNGRKDKQIITISSIVIIKGIPIQIVPTSSKGKVKTFINNNNKKIWKKAKSFWRLRKSSRPNHFSSSWSESNPLAETMRISFLTPNDFWVSTLKWKTSICFVHKLCEMHHFCAFSNL